MPLSSLEMIRKGDVDSLPLILGLTSQEGAWLAAAFYGQDSKERLHELQKNLRTGIRSLTANFLPQEVRLTRYYRCYYRVEYYRLSRVQIYACDN